MTRIAVTVVVATLVAPLASCTQQSRSPEQQPPSAAVQARPIEGTVTQLSSNHGNVYTSIRPADYESLGLAAGKRVRVTFGDADAMTLVIGRDYADVPSGSPLAVLHREGLTFAIRDGNFSRTYGIDVGDTFRLSPAEPR
jgi:S-adenosylmethionine hydrolase